jgi:(p)ppGpp synthase/HD superfamily hydrolase
MIRQFELVERVQSYDPHADEDMLNRAYVYGLKKHGTQLRASGDPYFSHPVEVAGILAEMKLDASSIVTGLLHDTIEDTDATRDEIAGMFGEDIARGSKSSRRAPRRRRTCASSFSPCRRTSACSW